MSKASIVKIPVATPTKTKAKVPSKLRQNKAVSRISPVHFYPRFSPKVSEKTPHIFSKLRTRSITPNLRIQQSRAKLSPHKRSPNTSNYVEIPKDYFISQCYPPYTALSSNSSSCSLENAFNGETRYAHVAVHSTNILNT